ncbi:MAG: hypothetical protein V1676_04870 [Candidatus Diapherotrites archaeon]
MALKGYFIQYKFILPDSVKHSSYTYQKLFRAIYGYTQNVTKSNGKTYHYHRNGVLSGVPYMRPGKNCVIIPQGGFNSLTTFFKTGKNPSHFWRGKGDWKAVYYMDEKTLSDKEVVSSLEALLERQHVTSKSGAPESLHSEMQAIAKAVAAGQNVDAQYKKLLVERADKVVNGGWFKESYSSSPRLAEFYKMYRAMKG